MKTLINSIEAEWSGVVKKLWVEKVVSKISDGETLSHANFYTARPWRNEHDRGSKHEGFSFFLKTPGNPSERVCRFQWWVGKPTIAQHAARLLEVSV